jgi:hypothetical protein
VIRSPRRGKSYDLRCAASALHAVCAWHLRQGLPSHEARESERVLLQPGSLRLLLASALAERSLATHAHARLPLRHSERKPLARNSAACVSGTAWTSSIDGLVQIELLIETSVGTNGSQSPNSIRSPVPKGWLRPATYRAGLSGLPGL